jgi:hypothetical protein
MKRILLVLAVLSASTLAQNAQQPTPPPYCKPCLFYGGDGDFSNPNTSWLANEDVLTGLLQSTVYVPFYVPTGQVWTIIGLFSNDTAGEDYILPPRIEWSISSGVSAGNSGNVIASGSANATLTPTGRSIRGALEYTALGHLTPETTVTLTAGVYWMTAVPVCTSDVHACLSENANFGISSVEDVPPPNSKGFEPNDLSYISVPSEGVSFMPTAGLGGDCPAGHCDRFSAGLLGYARPSN